MISSYPILLLFPLLYLKKGTGDDFFIPNTITSSPSLLKEGVRG
jgi:hypothetical protein